IPVRHPAAALVKAEVAVVPAEEAHPVGPDRALAVVLQVGQPGCRLYQRWPAAGFRPGQLDVVGGFDVVHLLLHWAQPLRGRMVQANAGGSGKRTYSKLDLVTPVLRGSECPHPFADMERPSRPLSKTSWRSPDHLLDVS